LTWRSADKDIDFLRLQHDRRAVSRSSAPAKTIRRPAHVDILDGACQHVLSEVLRVRRGCPAIEFYSHNRMKARALKAERKAAAPREKIRHL
jgi:hypothetical protein